MLSYKPTLTILLQINAEVLLKVSQLTGSSIYKTATKGKRLLNRFLCSTKAKNLSLKQFYFSSPIHQ